MNIQPTNEHVVVAAGRKRRIPKPAPIVTRESLQEMIKKADREKLQHIIGRALSGLFDRQTKDEKAINETVVHNNIGFTGADAKSGSLTAKYYQKHKRLEDWQINRWIKPSPSTGLPRLCKYHAQLNEIAMSKSGVKA